MCQFIGIISLACIVLLLRTAVGIDYDVWQNIEIQHKLNCDDENFCKRGNISLKSIRSGTSVVDQILFNKKHIMELIKLAEDDDFYTIRAIVRSSDNKGFRTVLLSSVKAKSFLDSGLSDLINAWLLPTGGVVAVNYQIANASQLLSQKSDGYEVNSNFYLRYIDYAPVPDTASYIQKLEREREAREKGDVKDNRSFIAKYWMYIVPVAIFIMISGATNSDTAGPPARQ